MPEEFLEFIRNEASEVKWNSLRKWEQQFLRSYFCFDEDAREPSGMKECEYVSSEDSVALGAVGRQ